MPDRTLLPRTYDEGGLMRGTVGDVLTVVANGPGGVAECQFAPAGSVGANPKPFSQMLFVDPSGTAGTPNGAVPSGNDTSGPYQSITPALVGPGPFWFYNAGPNSVAPITLPAGTFTLLQGRNGFGDVTVAAGGAGFGVDGSSIGSVTSPDGCTLIATNQSTIGPVNVGAGSTVYCFGGSTLGSLTTGPTFIGIIEGGLLDGWTSGGDGILKLSGIPPQSSIGSFTLAANDQLLIAGGGDTEIIQAAAGQACFVQIDGTLNSIGVVSGDSMQLVATNARFNDDITVATGVINGGHMAGAAKTVTVGQHMLIDGALFGDSAPGPTYTFILADGASLDLRNLRKRDPADVVTFVVTMGAGATVTIDETTAAVFPDLQALTPAFSVPSLVTIIGGRTVAFGQSVLDAGASAILGPFTVYPGELLSVEAQFTGAVTTDVSLVDQEGFIGTPIVARWFRASGDPDGQVKVFVKNASGDNGLTIQYALRARYPQN